MKKIIILSFCFLTIVFADNEYFSFNDNNTIDFILTDLEIEKVDDYHKIIVPQKIGDTGLIGMPKLPTYTTLLMVDSSKKYRIEYVVKKSYFIDNISIIPNQKMEKGLEIEQIIDKNLKFYNSSNKFPNINVSISDKMIMRDVVLINLSVIPFNYFPETNQLEVYESIEINLIEDGTDDINNIFSDRPKSRVFEKIYQNEILNYNRDLRDDDYQTPSVLYICSGSSENNGSFQQLVDWRTQRGYKVYTVSTSVIGNNASSIKDYISNAYQNFNPPPEYVALVGDVNGSFSIPTYYEDFGHDSYGNQCEGDLPYSQLDGGDLFPEVLVGRMSITSSSELAAVVTKIITYEKATYLGNLDNYYSRAAMAGDPSTSGNSCAITKEYVQEILEAHGVDDVDIKTSGSSWSSWMQNELNDGVLYFNYRGYLGMSGFSTGDVDNISNGFKLPFATVLTCGTGSFAEDQTSMSEKFFRAGTVTNPKGAVAAVGTATWNTHTLFNNIVDMGMYDGIFANDVGTAGAALASGKLALYNTYSNDPYQWINAFTQWNNLIGDPVTHLWTKTPEEFVVNHPNQISQGTNFINVFVEDLSGNAVENAMVTMLVRGNPVNYFTNQLGEVVLNFNNALSDDILITVTKQDYKPYQSSVDVSFNGSLVNLNQTQDLLINDGNNNIAESGETFDLSLPLKNFGNEIVNNFTVDISSSTSHVIINSASVNYGSINPNETIYIEGFNLTVLPTAIQGEDLGLVINVTDDNFNNSSSILDFSVDGSHLLAAGTINLNPGQSSNIDILLINSGSILARNITGELISNNNLITINDDSGSWGDIAAGQIVNSSDGFNITLSDDIINGTQIVLTLHIQGSQGYDRIENVIVSCGYLSALDPLGPDQYGYYIYDSNDTDYSFAPEYSWIEIDPDYGGTGTNLNLSNSGDGNWNGNGPITQINLPFDFKFYGIDYDVITVCTNGWISLGSSFVESFRNYPIPGPGGPSPMIAAFWDDLETGNSGDVFYKEYNDYVIIEWSDMRTQNNNSLETFQVILYNNSAQPYGDNEIKIQYKEFNNTSSGSFSSYPPIHGAYSTIGIENHLATDGLQYTFLNEYAQAASILSDNSALLITTEPSVTLPTPNLNYSYDNLSFELESNQLQESSLYISNNGEIGSLLNYSVSVSYPEIESPFDVSGGAPDSYGYYWSDSNISNDLGYEWIDIDSNQQASFINNDNSTELIDIGFDFPFYGESYSQFLINPNGWIGFTEDNDEWYNGDIPSLEYPKAAIFGFWDDLNPVNDNCNSSCSGNVYYSSTNDYLVVWFDNVYHWASEGYENSYYDFQIVIYSNGEVTINHRNINGQYSATVGMQNSTGTIGIQVDEYSGDYFENNVSYKFIRPYFSDWLSIYSQDGLNGELYNGESVEIVVVADATDVNDGEYSASLIVSSSTQNSFSIPVNLVVAELGNIGDLNNDDYIDVLDIVALVAIVLNSGDYVYNGDLNQDGLIDVLDVVSLVNIILNG